MARFSKNLSRLWKSTESLASGVVVRKKVSVQEWSLAGLQWVYPTISGGDDIAISIYSCLLPWDAKELEDVDPATNPFWHLEGDAVFDTLPGASETTEMLTLSASPFATMLVEITPAIPITDFTMLFRGQEY